MEIEYIEKKIKDELINKPFREWNKDSIDFLLRVFESSIYYSFTTINLILFKDYISWKEKNTPIQCMESIYLDEEMYSLEDLKKIYSIINENIANNRYYNYVYMIQQFKKKEVKGDYLYCDIILDNLFAIIAGIIFIIFYFIFKKSLLEHYFYKIKKPFLNSIYPSNFESISSPSIFPIFLEYSKNIPIFETEKEELKKEELKKEESKKEELKKEELKKEELNVENIFMNLSKKFFSNEKDIDNSFLQNIKEKIKEMNIGFDINKIF
jgi:hypothetical protein